jgi:hypothetical protein
MRSLRTKEKDRELAKLECVESREINTGRGKKGKERKIQRERQKCRK